MIAPFVALHYAINIAASEPDNRTVDITEYARKHLDATTLANVLLSNSGAHTDDLINAIFAPASGDDFPKTKTFNVEQYNSSSDSYEEYKRLRSYFEMGAVAVMSYIATDAEFTSAASSSYHGKRARIVPKPEGHAMVLIGIQHDSLSGQYWLMMQNSWSKQPVLEVRQDYAASRETSLTFVLNPQIGYPATWPTVTYHSATAAVDAGVLPGRFSKAAEVA